MADLQAELYELGELQRTTNVASRMFELDDVTISSATVEIAPLNVEEEPEEEEPAVDQYTHDPREKPHMVLWLGILSFLRGLRRHKVASGFVVVGSILFALLGALVFEPLSRDSWISVGLLITTIGLLVAETLPIPLIFLLVNIALMTLEIITPNQAMVGFGNSGVATVGVLFVVAEGLQRSAMFRPLLQLLLHKPCGLLDAQLRIMLPTALLSAFINNTPVVAMMIPVVRRYSQTTGIPASLLYMPMNIAAVLGGTITVIGTSTNLVVTGFVAADGLVDPGTGQAIVFPTFSISKASAPYALIGIVAAIILSRWLLSKTRESLLSHVIDDPRKYTVLLTVKKGSDFDGISIAAAGLRHLKGLFLAEITRVDGSVMVAPAPTVTLAGEDTLLFVGVVESVTELYNHSSLRMATRESRKIAVARHLRQLFEVVVSPTSDLVGSTIRESNFRRRFQAVIIAVCRQGEVVRDRIGDIVFQPGDLLLLESGPDTILKGNPHFSLVSAVDNSSPNHENWQYMALGFLLLLTMILWSQLADTHFLICSSVTAIALLVTGCLTLQQATAAIPISLLVTIAASFGLATALDSTGAAQAIAGAILGATSWAGTFGVIFGVYITTAMLTEVITNNAAAALVCLSCLTVWPSPAHCVNLILSSPLFFASSSFTLLTLFFFCNRPLIATTYVDVSHC